LSKSSESFEAFLNNDSNGIPDFGPVSFITFLKLLWTFSSANDVMYYSFGVPRSSNISLTYLLVESPLKNGFLNKSSAKIQPTDHISTAGV